ncbi:hypothetical protein FB45DRAFT_463820 [Roridomyces roridus]|uniref:Uncharacterized protein n=1 Tax=Roridomyces roridus TaxID=1738132 RepID=A0AAD7AZZ8_9AGAR|nr:hypothetical protein FB45DRAFT_463820 [Roridomyces roridus]
MVRHIPDEIVHEILSPALSVPDEAFSAASTGSPFRSSLDLSSSTILLVSKSWLRVATPLLYSVVIIRSKGQAQALDDTLRSNLNLGKFIKKLRVEGGYAMSMHKILQTAKNLTDILLCLDIDVGDTTSGLCRGLPLISPVRVILAYEHHVTRTAARHLLEALVEIIPKWKKLVVFEMPHREWGWDCNTVARALKSAPNLQSLVISRNEKDLIRRGVVPDYIKDVARNPSLQEIRPKARSRTVLNPEFLQAVQSDARLRKLFDLDHWDIRTKNPVIYPPQLAADPGLAEKIWDRVLCLLYRDELCSNDPPPEEDDDEYVYDLATRRLNPLFVCKQFLRLATPYFYERMNIHSSERMGALARRLKDHPVLGSRVRHISLFYSTDQNTDNLGDLLFGVPGLVSFTSVMFVLPWEIFDGLSRQCGASLHMFRGPVAVGRKPNDPAVFSRFSQLRCLEWNSKMIFKTPSKSAASEALDTLTDLIITEAHASFFTVLSRMRLPSLRSLTVAVPKPVDSQAFFQKHGGKIEELTVKQTPFILEVINGCPSTKVLTIDLVHRRDLKKAPKLDKIFEQCERHALVGRIIFRPLWSGTDTYDVQLGNFISMFDRIRTKMFPAVREIQHREFDWSNPDAKYSWCAEDYEKQGIKLVDQPGARWRPRRHFVVRKVDK